jgi:hypothetical protein
MPRAGGWVPVARLLPAGEYTGTDPVIASVGSRFSQPETAHEKPEAGS